MTRSSLKIKILFLLIGTFLFLETINICTGSVFLYVSYKDLEHTIEGGNNNRIIHAIENEIESLGIMTLDWSAWDDMYYFIHTRSRFFSDSNLNSMSLESNRLNILYCFDRSGNIVWGMDYDYSNKSRASYNLFPLGRLDDKSPIRAVLNNHRNINGTPIKGILPTEKGNLLIAAFPVIRSDRSGPPNGILIMGKFLSTEFHRKIEEQTNLKFEIIPVNEVPADTMNTPLRGNAPHGTFFRTEHEGNEYFYSPVPGINGKAVSYIRRLSPGDIRKNGAFTILFTQILLGLSTITVGVVIVRAIYKWIIKPIEDLLKRIQTIKSAEDINNTASAVQNNEIENLTKEFDSLMTITTNQKTLLEEKIQLLESLARIDQLTQLYNRRYLDEMLKSEWNRLKRENRPITFILMDVDFFKAYNDTYGHIAGDDCLTKIGNVIRSSAIRITDTAARYGSEEFALLLPGTTEEDGMQIAQKILDGISAIRIEHSESPSGFVTISAGIATLIPDNTNNRSDIVSQADKALYRSKNEGRNRISVFRNS